MKSACYILIYWIAAFVSGCTLIPKYDRPNPTVAHHFPGVQETNAISAADLSWREVFKDARLDALIEIALTNNLDLRLAILRVEQSRAQYRISRSTELPSVSANGSYARSHAGGRTEDAWSASIGTTAYEVDLFGRVRSLNQQALEKYLATLEGRRVAQLALIAEIASQYYAQQHAQSQLDLSRETLAIVQESYSLSRSTFEAGASTELDLRTAQSQVETTRIAQISYQRRVEQLEHGLVLLLGQPLPEGLPAPSSFPSQLGVAEIPVGLPSDLVQRRPDILQAEHTLRAAHANIGAARAAFFPSIKFTASAGTTSSQFDALFGSGTGLWSFSPQVTLPIFTSGLNRADLDAAKVGQRIEVANYQKTIQTAFREVADALVALRSSGDQLSAQTRLIEAQRRRFELANLRYRQGDGPYLEVLSAQQDLYTAQQNQLETTLSRVQAQISLYQALGGGWK